MVGLGVRSRGNGVRGFPCAHSRRLCSLCVRWDLGRQRLDDFAAFGSEFGDQFGRGLETVAVVAPVRAVANDQHAALAGVCAPCGAVRHAVDEESRITGLEWDFDRGFDLVERVGPFFKGRMQ